jgi:hypothetical protein
MTHKHVLTSFKVQVHNSPGHKYVFTFFLKLKFRVRTAGQKKPSMNKKDHVFAVVEIGSASRLENIIDKISICYVERIR